MNMILLFTFLTVFNVIIQTMKSLCTVRCSTSVSACVNAVAYGLYTFVIFYTTADGMSLWMKAGITAIANFFGVYIANFLFSKLFDKTTRWKVEVSVPERKTINFEHDIKRMGLEAYVCGYAENWRAYAVFCEDKEDSANLKAILPDGAKYNVVECVKRL